MRKGSKQRRLARVKRRRKLLAQLLGPEAAVGVLAGAVPIKAACAGLGALERARVRELAEQIAAEAER